MLTSRACQLSLSSLQLGLTVLQAFLQVAACCCSSLNCNSRFCCAASPLLMRACSNTRLAVLHNTALLHHSYRMCAALMQCCAAASRKRPTCHQTDVKYSCTWLTSRSKAAEPVAVADIGQVTLSLHRTQQAVSLCQNLHHTFTYRTMFQVMDEKCNYLQASTMSVDGVYTTLSQQTLVL